MLFAQGSATYAARAESGPSKKFYPPRNLTDTSAPFIFDETRTWLPENVSRVSKAPENYFNFEELSFTLFIIHL